MLVWRWRSRSALTPAETTSQCRSIARRVRSSSIGPSDMSILQIGLRALVAYVFLLALVRVSGKRLISEATGMQFVLAIIMGDLVDEAMLATTPFAQLIAAAGTLTLLHLIVTIAAAHKLRVWRLVEGEPAVLLQN